MIKLDLVIIWGLPSKIFTNLYVKFFDNNLPFPLSVIDLSPNKTYIFSI